MTDIPSRSFGSEHKWHFKSEHDLLIFFNCNFTLPSQNSWTVCQHTSVIAMRVISVLRMTSFTLDDWRQLPTAEKNIGITGKSTQLLWEWTLTFRVPTSKSGSDSYPVSQHESEQAIMVTENKLKIAQSVARLRPLGRRSRWPVTPILPKSSVPNASYLAFKSCWTEIGKSTRPRAISSPSNLTSPNSLSKRRTNKEQLNASGQPRI